MSSRPAVSQMAESIVGGGTSICIASAVRSCWKSRARREVPFSRPRRIVCWHYLQQGVLDSIPSAHEPQARANHGQSLDVLAQRGGLSPYELLAVLLDHRFWRCICRNP